MTNLIAKRPILYLADHYKPGDKLPQDNQIMVELWVKYDSAEFEEDKNKTSKVSKTKKEAQK